MAHVSDTILKVCQNVLNTFYTNDLTTNIVHNCTLIITLLAYENNAMHEDLSYKLDNMTTWSDHVF